jgi:hypothetical protein
VSPGADLDACIVAGSVRLPAGFRAREAVIVPASVLCDRDAVAVRDGVAIFPLGPYNGTRG